MNFCLSGLRLTYLCRVCIYTRIYTYNPWLGFSSRTLIRKPFGQEFRIYEFSRGSRIISSRLAAVEGWRGGKAPARDWIKVVAGFSCARLDARRTCKKPYFFIYGRCPRRKYRGLALPVPFRLVSFRFDLSTFSLFFFFFLLKCFYGGRVFSFFFF